MRWILLLLSLFGFWLMLTTKSPTLLGIGLLIGTMSFLGSILSFAAARIARTAQTETTLIVDPEVSALRIKANGAKNMRKLNAPSNNQDS